MSSAELAVQMTDVVKTFEKGRVRALDGASMSVQKGEFVAIMGPSGCGKSTILHLVGALDHADSGVIIVNGENLANERNLSKHRAHEIGIVFQLDNLLPTLNAIENVEVPMFETRMNRQERRARAGELLSLVGLAGKERNQPSEM